MVLGLITALSLNFATARAADRDLDRINEAVREGDVVEITSEGDGASRLRTSAGRLLSVTLDVLAVLKAVCREGTVTWTVTSYHGSRFVCWAK